MQTPPKHIIAIGAGKGGVGKSTLSVNLAVALADQSLNVGLLDADLYGPSIPIMLGLRRLSPPKHEGRVLPFHKFGVHAVSLGFFVEENRSVLWRGPMLHQMLHKMLDEISWPPLDILLIDLPPGTGDVPLSLHKLIKVTGALLITSPQKVAFQDVVRAHSAFAQLQIPLLGLVENFSGYLAPNGMEFFPFGKSNAEEHARDLGVPCLAKIPLQDAIREGGDAGIACPKLFYPLADKLCDLLGCSKRESTYVAGRRC